MDADESPVCSRYDATVVCHSRRDAMRAGEMYYDARIGWIFPAEHRAWPKANRETMTPPMGWSWCVFCGGHLPDAVTMITKLLAEDLPSDTDED
jgi:hypothetical protein